MSRAVPILSAPPRDLLGDGALALAVDPSLEGALERWAWPLSALAPADGAPRALVTARTAPVRATPPPATRPDFHARHLGAWMHPRDAAVTLASHEADVWGSIDLAAARAEVRVANGDSGPEVRDLALYGAVWIAAALLLGRQGRVMVHAAAVLGPDGGAWLLAADTHGGKTTTCVNLIRAGCDYLSDDHVVIAADPAGGLRATGWPRRFHMDTGFEDGRSEGVRLPVDPARYGPGRRRGSAPLAGVLFPRVQADAPTRATPVHPAATLGRLIRHAPWLLADPPAARPLLSVMERMARLPACDLSLGRDTYTDPSALLDRLPWR